VRIGPNALAFNTAQAFRDIYTIRSGHQSFPKDPSEYGPPPNGVHNLVTSLDDEMHARQRKLMAPAFSERSIKAIEGLVTGYVDTLIRKLKEQKGIIDIKAWMNYTTFDITGDLVFGEPFGCLDEGVMHPWIGIIFNAIKMISVLSAVNQFPALKYFLAKCIPQSIKQKSLDHFKFSAEKVDRRLGMQTERQDVIAAIVKNGLSEDEGQYHKDEKVMTRSEIHSNAFV
jgi:cytochrome P450